MNFRYFAIFSFVFSILVSCCFMIVTYFSNARIVDGVSKDFLAKTKNELELIANLVRNDLLQGNIRSARNQIARMISFKSIQDYQIVNHEESSGSISLSEDENFFIVEIPISFETSENEWGRLIFKVANSEIKKLSTQLNSNLLVNSFLLLILVLLFLSMFYYLIYFYSNKFKFNLSRSILGIPVQVSHSVDSRLFHPLYLELGKIAEVIKVSSRMNIELNSYADIIRLARQVSHDIKSPVSALLAVIQKEHGLPLSSKKLLEKSVSRINEISSQLLDQTKAHKVHRIEINVLRVVFDDLVQEKMLLGIQVDLLLNCMETVFNGNLIGLKAVLSNLINNSYEAMSANQSPQILLKMDCSNDFVTLSVADYGPGIKPELIQLILAGQYTSKEKGSSLGLSSSKQIIESWGGQFEINSQIGKGTTVSLRFIPEK